MIKNVEKDELNVRVKIINDASKLTAKWKGEAKAYGFDEKAVIALIAENKGSNTQEVIGNAINQANKDALDFLNKHSARGN